ncbi:hypothetical protein HMSSN139_61420 [Paenibacillus sp. HMSSN-139]|nr:hypothetical protein HMSSN139_61420 [Paenibacillus sp. HMSSN-139]
MFEGFLEMQSVVTRVQGRLELGGEQEYRRIEFGTERSCTRQNRVIGSETRKTSSALHVAEILDPVIFTYNYSRTRGQIPGSFLLTIGRDMI